MVNLPSFYTDEHEFQNIYRTLKLTPCPSCRGIGNLILHGYLSGYDEISGAYPIRRGRRIFCSNRKKRKGCGRTFSLLMARFLRCCIFTATTLWAFIQGCLSGLSKQAALGVTGVAASSASAYRWWQRIRLGLPHIRSCLSRVLKPPQLLSANPLAQTVDHLLQVFKDSSCPIAAFQQHFQRSFFPSHP